MPLSEAKTFLNIHTKINSKWIKDLNVRPEFPWRKTQAEHSDINRSMILFDPTPRVTKIKPKINKWDLIKFKSSYTAKETINKMKRTVRMGENICK